MLLFVSNANKMAVFFVHLNNNLASYKQFKIKPTSENTYIQFYHVQNMIKQLTWRGISSNHQKLAPTSSV